MRKAYKIALSILVVVAFFLTTIIQSGFALESPIAVWSKNLAPSNGYFSEVIQASDGGYLMSGTSGNQAFLVKTDSSGNQQWTKLFSFNETVQSNCRSAVETSDGGFALACDLNSESSMDSYIWILKVDSHGDQQWNKTYGSLFDYTQGISIVQTNDSGLAFAWGAVNTNKLWISKTDALGNIQFTQSFDSSGTVKSLVLTNGNEYVILAGNFLFKINSFGNLEWSRSLASNDCRSMIQSNDGNYVIVGSTPSWVFSAGFLCKIDSSGNQAWNMTPKNSEILFFTSITQTKDGGYVLLGVGFSSHPGVVKIDSTGTIQWTFIGNTTTTQSTIPTVQDVDTGFVFATREGSLAKLSVDTVVPSTPKQSTVPPTSSPSALPSPTVPEFHFCTVLILSIMITMVIFLVFKRKA